MIRPFRYLLPFLVSGLLLPAAPATITTLEHENTVYGEAGPGRIQVRVRVNFVQVGLHWLPAGTKLGTLLTQAQMLPAGKEEFGPTASIVILRRRADGSTEKLHFGSSPLHFGSSHPDSFVLEAKGEEFTLLDGDVVVTAYWSLEGV